MKTQAKILLTGILSLQFLLIGNLYSQDQPIEQKVIPRNYSDAMGIRFGTDFGFSYKHFLKSDVAWEAILSSGYRTFDFTFLYEKHTLLFKTPGLNLFYGGGVHAGFFQRRLIADYDPNYYYYYSYNSDPSIGIAGIIGVEYKFPLAPISIGIDLKPVLDFYYPGYAFLDGAFTVRYIFHGPG